MRDNLKCPACRLVMQVEEEKKTQYTYFCAGCGKRRTELKAEHRREFVPYGRVSNAR